MPPIPTSSLLSNRAAEMLLSRRKLMEKIMQHVTFRKVQNSLQATGDRMAVTPQQFGMQVGSQIKKAFGVYADAMAQARGQKAMNPLQAGMLRMMNPSLAKHIGDDGVFRNPELPATPAPKDMAPAADAAAGACAAKQAAVVLPAAGIGAGLGAVTSPSGHRMEGLGRGAVKGTATGAGVMAGAPVGALGMLGLSLAMPGVGKKLFGPSSRQLGDYLKHLARKGKLHKAMRPGHIRPEKKLELMNTLLGGAAVGAPLGGAAGYGAANAAMGAPSWEGKTASLLSTLGGVAGGGIGGLAGGAGGGIMGALTGGALGGPGGAGLGLLAGGAAGLGAGAHLGSNIGSSIGAGFSKKKKKPESDEKEEKSEEKSEDSGDEEVKESAARVLAQLQKNAGKPIVGGISLDELARVRADQAKYKQPAQPMSGVAGAMQRVGDTSAKMPTAGVGVVPKMVGQNIGAMAPAVQAAGNKLVAGEKKLAPQATGGISMFGMLPGLAGNLGRSLGGK